MNNLLITKEFKEELEQEVKKAKSKLANKNTPPIEKFKALNHIHQINSILSLCQQN